MSIRINKLIIPIMLVICFQNGISAQTLEAWRLPFGVGLYDANIRYKGDDLEKLSGLGLDIQAYKRFERYCQVGSVFSCAGIGAMVVLPAFANKDITAGLLLFSGFGVFALGELIKSYGLKRISFLIEDVNKRIVFGFTENGLGLALTF